MLLLGFSRFGGKNKEIKCSRPKSSAFTLAEVLITLGIIGVVAAMTMPTIINKVNHVVLKNQFKKMYSVLSTAIQKTNFEMDFNTDCYYYTNKLGERSSNVRSGCPAFFKEYLPENLKVIKTCDGNGFDDGCLPDYDWPALSSGCGGFNSDSIKSNSYVAVLNDGSLLFTYNKINGALPLVGFDVNGKKGPNKVGYDVFAFNMGKFGSNIYLGRDTNSGTFNSCHCLIAAPGGICDIEQLMH